MADPLDGRATTAKQHGDSNNEGDSDSDVFASPATEQPEALLSKNILAVLEDRGSQNPGNSPQMTSELPEAILPMGERTRPHLRHSSSDLAIDAKRRFYQTAKNTPCPNNKSAAYDVDNGHSLLYGVKNIGGRSPGQTSARAWRSLRRSSSDFRPERRTQDHGHALDSTALQKSLAMRIKYVGNVAARPQYLRNARSAATTSPDPRDQYPRQPSFKGFPAAISSEIPTTAQSTVECKGTGEMPLQLCMKKSKSTSPTPPGGHRTSSSIPDRGQKLRRSKTVDFEEAVSQKLLSLPLSKTGTRKSVLDFSKGLDRTEASLVDDSHEKTVHRAFHYLEPTAKSKPADTAVTRTDVHVVAMTSSQTVDDKPIRRGTDLATPTMQIVESNASCYEVVWDDIHAEHDVERNRRSFSATQALETVASSSTTKGLERVNSKLTEWTWASKGPRDRFKPQIIVFPESDGRDPSFEYSVEEDGDVLIIAPPDSERPSENPSRRASQLQSTRISSSGSHDDLVLASLSEHIALEEKNRRKQDCLVVPDPEVLPRRPESLAGASTSSKKPSTDRRLSNIDESEMKFRGHRDSVTLARARIFNAGGISPELLMHRDSVTIAKRRLRAKNHAAAASRANPQSHSLSPGRKWDAIENLENKSSTSTLSPQPAGADGHIRIPE
ncbi:hypothetical protein CC78DRAFT_30934 [Lojkania enalia]|uniref:Uncharacterized protein n=1 Tax=Lojkania enalia TaxID=147567 RepID=A0A9P4N928_9PLEO|nr:hypothetical protein CC78DRAFT_30934 [Didymosphaeria enalia]